MYLVTGGTGFIGCYIVKQLILRGKQVIAYDALLDKNLMVQILGKEWYDQVAFKQGDVTNFSDLVDTCKQNGVNVIIHMAAIIGKENPPHIVNVNCNGTINVLEAGSILGMKRVVLASSYTVFGPHNKYEEEYIPNNAPHYPSGIYGASKSFNEVCAMHYFAEYGLDTISIRLQEVYGFGRRAARSAKKHEALFVKPALGVPSEVSNGDAIHNWMYVEDAARAMVMASSVAKTETRAFTANGYVRSTAEVAAYIRTIIPDTDITLLPGTTNNPYKFDTTPIQTEIGYKPEWTIELGAQKYIIDVRKQNKTK